MDNDNVTIVCNVPQWMRNTIEEYRALQEARTGKRVLFADAAGMYFSEIIAKVS